jgi:phospholipase C
MRIKKINWLPDRLTPFLFLALFALILITFGTAAGPSPVCNTTTPIKHVVIIFQENNSFDHYFGTYPHAQPVNGKMVFHPKDDTPKINGLTEDLLTHNQNSAQPFLITDLLTCNQGNGYKAEQEAYDQGAADEFVEFTEGTGCAVPYEVMGYYDGGIVTGLWNYAQNYAMSDNFFGTTFGPTCVGHINLVSGQSHGAVPTTATSSVIDGTLVVNMDPTYDNVSTGDTVAMTGKNMGDLLNAKNVTWGSFVAGFANPTGNFVCNTGTTLQYNPHYEPFQYYASTANPAHLPPTSVAMIGYADQANHQYDLTDLWTALDAHNLPAVCYVKGNPTQTGHPGDSNPLCEQQFLVDTINRLQKSPEWKDMAIFVTYDDSDGWYDHQAPPVVNTSASSVDPAFSHESSNPPMGGYEVRAGYGPRMPLLVISPYAKDNYVDHGITDQTSILRFVEDNWNLGRIGDYSFDAIAGSLVPMFDFDDGPRRDLLILDPTTGQVAGQHSWD